MARGKKICPNCDAKVGARTQVCNCGWKFVVKTVKENNISPKVAYLLAEVGTYVAPLIITKKGHAKRILKYGAKRAGMLLRLHNTHGYWNHVDWNVVKLGLEI